MSAPLLPAVEESIGATKFDGDHGAGQLHGFVFDPLGQYGRCFSHRIGTRGDHDRVFIAVIILLNDLITVFNSLSQGVRS